MTARMRTVKAVVRGGRISLWCERCGERISTSYGKNLGESTRHSANTNITLTHCGCPPAPGRHRPAGYRAKVGA